MAKKKTQIPKYGTITLKGIQYYRTRITDADGKELSLYAATCEELYEKQLEARKQVEEIIFHRPDSSRVWREVAADAVGKGVCVYTQRLYEGYDKLYHQTSGRDVYGRSDC